MPAKATRVVSRKSRRSSLKRTFSFSKEMVPSQNGQGSQYVKDYRNQAWEAFNQLPIPDTRMEAWRRTDLRGLEAGSFRLPQENEFEQLPPVPDGLLAPLVGDAHGGQMVLLPGGMTREISPETREKGVIFTDLASAEREHPQLLASILGKVVRPDEGKFSALTASLGKAGIVVYVPKNVHLDQPLHSVVWSPGVGLANLFHLIIVLEEGASLTYVHEMASPDDTMGQSLTAGITEVLVCPNADLQFVELQSLGVNVWNFAHERVKVERDGRVDWIFGAIGSRLTKNFSDLDLVSPGASGRMSGFYFTDRDQHLDHDTQQNHMAENTTSDLLFKGALKDTSRSVWQGMIYVAPGAQKTDGYQANRNLILDKRARADSIPGLEILADDVRCTHGATVGKIDPDLVFYLQSRGIPKENAERLIVEGFFDPILQRIPFEGVRNRFIQAIKDKLG